MQYDLTTENTDSILRSASVLPQGSRAKKWWKPMHTPAHICVSLLYRKNTKFEYLSSVLVLALVACSNSGSGSSKTATGRVIIAGRPKQTADTPTTDKTPTKTDTKTENKDPPDEPVIATTLSPILRGKRVLFFQEAECPQK